MGLQPAVIIDGAVPHDPDDRLDLVFEYCRQLLIEQLDRDVSAATDGLIELGRISGEYRTMNDLDDADMAQVMTECEDKYIDLINQHLDDGWVCTVGEFNPGDVIVREVGHVEDEIAGMGMRG